ncbi:glycosyltransferase family 4 protein [Kribbella sp. CA-294648]|uniref:glycosyltransferase family 4 protein n=1 Tax=Kribbella sp. CA-294648 TaxID=3239948 RepID=UPI003D8B965C
MNGPRVLVVAHYASARLGGEAAIPLELFGRLRDRGVEAWLLTHTSCGAELRATRPDDADRIFCVDSLPGFGPLLPIGERLPVAGRALAWSVTQLERQQAMMPAVRRLVRELGITVVHQPISVSPTIPSPVRRVGVPVVMGPLNGGMDLPPAFRGRDSRFDRVRKLSAPRLRGVLNRLLPGRLEAAVVLVANDRTRALLPTGLRGEVRRLSDIGVDLGRPPVEATEGEVPQLCFVGRLVPLKGVDLLLRAFAEVADELPAGLTIVGDGPQRKELEALTATLGVEQQVAFTGWLAPEACAQALSDCDLFVFPSLQEAGGVVVLEAMAAARPVIAARWGGPAELLDDDCAILLDVDNRESFHRELVSAIRALCADPVRRRRMGQAGRRRAEGEYDWNGLVDRTLAVYQEVSVPSDAWAGRTQGVSIKSSD